MTSCKIVLITVAVVGLTGFKYPLTASPVTEPAKFTLVDQVPSWEKESKRNEGATTRECLWGANRIGDKDLSIDRITYLRDRLASRGNQQLTGRTLVVSNFTIHMNSGFLSRKSGQIGFLGKWINKEPVDCPTDNLLGSYSTVEADPASNPMVLVIVADVDMDGHTVHHRKVQPLGKGALQSALDEIADEIIAVASVQAG